MSDQSRRHYLRTTITALTGLSAGLAGCNSTNPPTEQPPTRTTLENPSETSTVTTTIRTTAHDGLRETIGAAEDGDAVVIDSDETVSSHINVRSNINIFGGGGIIRLEDNSPSGSIFRLEDVENVWIDGVKLDGNRTTQSNAGGGLIGGLRLGSVSNVRITNCTIKNAYSNGIMLGEKTQGKGNFSDIYIANNRILNCRRHGIILGVKNSPGTIHDVIIEGNRVKQFDAAIGITVFGVNGVNVHRVAIIGNTCRNTGGTSNGSAIAFEEQVHHCLAYANSVEMWGRDSVNGLVCTKDAHQCILGNNRVRNSRDGLGVMNFDYYQPQGPPKSNLVTHNDVMGCRSGFAYRNLEGDLTVYRNYMMNNKKNINNQGNNTGDGYSITQNGPDVPRDPTGLPETIGTSVTYNEPDGTQIGTATWSRGTTSPENPVSVDVTTLEQ